jgi:P4 family phage/plasmid primase-like protien
MIDHDPAHTSTATDESGVSRTTYSGAVWDYRKRGWLGAIPTEFGTKFPPPVGCTGKSGPMPSAPDVQEWIDNGGPKGEDWANGNLGVRLPDDFVAVDVDDYTKGDKVKRGGKTLAEAQKLWGPLRHTWVSTAREDGVSGARLYRIPPGVKLKKGVEIATDDGELLGDIDVIQFHHRYVLAWPSINPLTDTPYRWRMTSDWQPIDTLPDPTQIPMLPDAWIEALRDHKPTAKFDLDDDALYHARDALTAGTPSPSVIRALDAALRSLTAPVCRHDAICRKTLALMHLGREGHPGVREAMGILAAAFVAAVAPSRPGGVNEAQAEFESFITSKGAAFELSAPVMDGNGGFWLTGDASERTLAPKPVKENKIHIPSPGEGTLTDAGNAARLADLRGEKHRYVADAGTWFYWTGQQWAVDHGANHVGHAATQLASTMPIPQAADGDAKAQKKRDAALKFKARSLMATGIDGAIRQAKKLPQLNIDSKQLDANAYEINTPTGIVDLRTGNVRPHEANSWHSKITAVGYDPTMPAPQWTKFLEDTFQGDKVLIGYVQRIFGLAAIGEVREHILPFLLGDGRNGKGVLLDTAKGTLGDGYVVTQPSNFLLVGREQHPTDIARLNGARLAICSEVADNGKFDEQKVKNLTGGEGLTGRFMGQNFVDFQPSHTLFLVGNHKPEVKSGGMAFWDRVKVIRFNYAVPEKDRVKGLSGKLIAEEGSAILAWIVAGAVDALANGMQTPQSVIDDSKAYADEEDHLAEFIAECIEKAAPTDRVQRTAVYTAYKAWCASNGYETMSSVGFGRELPKRGFVGAKSDGKRVWTGVSINSIAAYGI